MRNYIKQWANSYRSTYLLESPEALKNYPKCLLAIQTEADLNPVAVSCRCFNVTYGFLGSVNQLQNAFLVYGIFMGLLNVKSVTIVDAGINNHVLNHCVPDEIRQKMQELILYRKLNVNINGSNL